MTCLTCCLTQLDARTCNADLKRMQHDMNTKACAQMLCVLAISIICRESNMVCSNLGDSVKHINEPTASNKNTINHLVQRCQYHDTNARAVGQCFDCWTKTGYRLVVS